MDRIRELAEEITKLGPEEKRRLFELLAVQEDLPGLSITPAPAGEQPAPLPKPGRSRSPDYVLTFDGGSRGNPGWGYGSYALTRVRDGAQILKRLDLGDNYTSNEAEYDTLIAALEDLLRRIAKARRHPSDFTLEVRGDSALVINQLQGRWQAKEPRMQQRRDRCLRLLESFAAVTLQAQPREESVRVLGH